MLHATRTGMMYVVNCQRDSEFQVLKWYIAGPRKWSVFSDLQLLMVDGPKRIQGTAVHARMGRLPV